ncbi:hypothetical protein NECAME_00782 [Necator americanus]|uniref:Uncharacterized protein n=1 Tax=Necator americanus TaxID=51031 RepID=W2SVX1_NECAM|nr:hypothetical protein NECAME_00782 [Necator americanus]ETN73693.1 hypothetical protein NECAME_00782 [Necator americanus]
MTPDMIASVPNPREVFRSDEFLVQLAQPSTVRFSPFEHAPVEERRERFREAIAQRKLALVDFESFPFLFNGVLCTARGHMDSNLLTGRVQFRLSEETNTARDGNETWSPEQINNLRTMGLPL